MPSFVGLKDYMAMQSLPLIAEVGSLSGVTSGSSTPQVIALGFGTGYKYDGINDEIDMGNLRSTCFGNLNNCPNGHSMAFWLSISTAVGNEASDRYIFSGGGQTSSSHGPCFAKRNSDFCAWYKKNAEAWAVCGAGVFDEPVHVVITWSNAAGLKLYVGGVMLAGQANPTIGSYNPSGFDNFYFGRPNNGLLKFGDFKMAHFMFWEEIISQDMIDRLGQS